MNYGFDQDSELVLTKNDEPFRHQIQLYEHVIESLALENRKLLEVGSGRGGGIDYLGRTKPLAALLGVDISEKAIEQCQQDYNNHKLVFTQGSADSLPIDSNSIDIVINVESSHCYPDIKAFLSEVHRVLVADGALALCDVRTPESMNKLENLFYECGFSVEKEQTITAQVISALEKMSNDRLKIADEMPGLLKRAFTDFAGIQSSTAYDMMKNNKLVYKSFILKK